MAVEWKHSECEGGALASSSHLFMKLHQTLLAGIRVLFVVKVLVVVHVPAHLLLVVQRALRGHVRSIHLIYQSQHWDY